MCVVSVCGCVVSVRVRVCVCVRLHAYSAREGTNIARTIRFCARLDNKIDRF